MMSRRNKNNVPNPSDDALREWFERLEWPPLDANFRFDQQRWHQEFPRRHRQRLGKTFPRPWAVAGTLILAAGIGTFTWYSMHGRFEPATAITPGGQFLAAKASPVIVEAMKALGSHSGVPLEAPQVIPYAKPPTTILSATAHVFGGSALPTYQVELWNTQQAWPVNNPHITSATSRRLAAYAGTNYAKEGLPGVRQGLQIESGYSVVPGPSTLVSIAPGITAKESHSSPSATSLAATSLRWTSGSWHMAVSAPSTRLAQRQAQQLVHSLASVRLPQTTTSGYLVVTSTASVTATGSPRIATEVIVTWNRKTTVYQVITYSDVQQPLETALLIAQSMRPYTP
jgi:hypothetical protein